MTPKNIPLNERIIFALDVDIPVAALQWVDRLESHVRFYKVGLQLFLAGWFPGIDRADHVVVGRPIRDAADPLAVVKSMQEKIAAGLNAATGSR